MPAITIYLKNLAGEVTPLDVPVSTSMEVLVQVLSEMDPVTYPPRRITVFRPWMEDLSDQEDPEEDQKSVDPPLTDGEVIAVFVSDEVQIETGRFPEGGKAYTRLAIPLDGVILYLYALYHTLGCESGERVVEYGASFSPKITKPSETYQAQSVYLFHTVRTLLPDVTPSQMRYLYDIVLPYYEERSIQEDRCYLHKYDPKEPMACECGAVVQRSSLPAHRKTKKHLVYVKSLST